jgi:hypothetical protein
MPLTPDILNEDCSDISDWTAFNQQTGTSSVSPAGQFKFETGVLMPAMAQRYRTITAPPDTFTLEVMLLCDAIGNSDSFLIQYSNNSWLFSAIFRPSGLFIGNSGGSGEVGTDVVICNASAAWQGFRFQVNKTDESTATVKVFIKEVGESFVSQGTFSCNSASSGLTNGKLSLTQESQTTPNRISHVDYIKVGTGLGSFDEDYYELPLADSVTISDAVTGKDIGLNKSDSVTLSASITSKAIGLNKADSMLLSEDFSRVAEFIRDKSDSVTLSEVFSKAIGLNKADDDLTLTDDLTMEAIYRKAINENLTLSDFLNIALEGIYSLSFNENLTLADSVVKGLSRQSDESVTLSDNFSKASVFTKEFADELSLVDSVEPTTVTLSSITIIARSMLVDGIQPIQVMGVYSDITVSEVTQYCSFVSSNTLVATINSTGTITGISPGITTITATVFGITANADVLVEAISSIVPLVTGIVAFAGGDTYRAATYVSKLYEYKPNSLGWIKVLASKYPVTIDIIFPDIPYTIPVIVADKKPRRFKSFMAEAFEVNINPREEVSAVFLASSIEEFPV